MIRFRISNMTCGGCAKGVTATLREAAFKEPLRFDLERREVEIDAAPVEAPRLKDTLAAAGWEAEDVVR